MNKSELTEKLAAKAKLSRKQAATIVETIFGTDRSGIICGELMKGKKVTITGFGGFEIRKRKARQGRNPQTGETIKIAASKFPAFHPGKALKDSVKK